MVWLLVIIDMATIHGLWSARIEGILRPKFIYKSKFKLTTTTIARPFWCLWRGLDNRLLQLGWEYPSTLGWFRCWGVRDGVSECTYPEILYTLKGQHFPLTLWSKLSTTPPKPSSASLKSRCLDTFLHLTCKSNYWCLDDMRRKVGKLGILGTLNSYH